MALACREVHPDVTGSADSAVLFLEVQSAYSTLMDPQKRAKYDARLRPRSKTVLSYLNARSAVRNGFNPSGAGSGVIDDDLRMELYSTMRDLLRQARRCMRQVESELAAQDEMHLSPVHERGPSGPQPPQPIHTARSSDGNPPSRLAPVHLHADCAEGEPCEPWLYYAALKDASRTK